MLTRKIEFQPAYDYRSRPGYGMHCVEIGFYIYGPKGTVQFKLQTNWGLPSMRADLLDGVRSTINKEYVSEMFVFPQALDLGYHSLVPRYEGQGCMRQECPYLDGKPCYYDGSTLNAEPILERLIAEGEEAVWRELEDYYHSLFDAADEKG
jgi:hypothetical protein